MQIVNMQSYTGRNIYSHKPVVRMVVDIEQQQPCPTVELPGFNARLLAHFPGLLRHSCSKGYEGGFAERLQEGTYIGHVTEHLILELQNLAGFSATYGKTRVLQEPCLYNIIYEYENEHCAFECGRAAVEAINRLIAGQPVDVHRMLEDILRTRTETELGPSTRAIYDEAIRRGIPVTRLGSESLLQLGYGKNARLVQASLTDSTSCIQADMAGNKHLVKQLLSDHGIPVPGGDIAYSEEAAVVTACLIGFPVVVKPFDGNQGKGVILNLSNEEQVRHAYQEASRYSKAVIVERFISGRDYRVLVVGGKVSAVAERTPPFITGDGLHTIEELVEMENRNPLRGEDHEKPLTKIKLDSTAVRVLHRNGLATHSIPEDGVRVVLRDNGNLSTGGTARECTEEIHPANADIAIRAARALGLDIAGIDMMLDDISTSLYACQGAIIEVNAAPGLRMHLYPTTGKSRNVASDILDMLYPADASSTIPIVSVTGTNGKTTTTRLIGHTLRLAGKNVGMTTTSGVYIGNECILKGDNTGPASARMVLSNHDVDAAVLETARGGLIRRGLGYDLADIGVITNISDDHLGLDGMDTLEDLAYVKSLVIEAVKPHGYAVLNADDGMVETLMARLRSNLVLFSKDPANAVVTAHRQAGGKAVCLCQNGITLYEGEKSTSLLALEDVPITFGGILQCNIENSLAATSALYALNIPPSIIKLGLKTFKPDTGINPGRFNLFDMGDYQVMLDYGHNSAGYKAVLDFSQKLGCQRLVGVIGMPGDRMDRYIAEIGALCGKVFSRLYIKEDDDLRGRDPGEVAGILYEAAVKAGTDKDSIEVVYSEIKALETAILDAQPGDLIVMFYEKFEPAMDLVNQYRQKLTGSSESAQIETAG